MNLEVWNRRSLFKPDLEGEKSKTAVQKEPEPTPSHAHTKSTPTYRAGLAEEELRPEGTPSVQ